MYSCLCVRHGFFFLFFLSNRKLTIGDLNMLAIIIMIMTTTDDNVNDIRDDYNSNNNMIIVIYLIQ